MTPTQKIETVSGPLANPSQPAAPALATKVCPRCGSDCVRESTTRRGMDLLPANLGKQAYRCRNCRSRFYLKREVDSETPATPQRRRSNRKRDPIWKHPAIRRHMNEITIAFGSLIAFAVFLYLLARTGIAY